MEATHIRTRTQHTRKREGPPGGDGIPHSSAGGTHTTHTHTHTLKTGEKKERKKEEGMPFYSLLAFANVLLLLLHHRPSLFFETTRNRRRACFRLEDCRKTRNTSPHRLIRPSSSSLRQVNTIPVACSPQFSAGPGGGKEVRPKDSRRPLCLIRADGESRTTGNKQQWLYWSDM